MALETGARIDIYEVTGKLGEGAMGEVYRARDFSSFALEPGSGRFLMRQPGSADDGDSFAPLNLTVVFNWFQELSEAVPNGLRE